MRTETYEGTNLMQSVRYCCSTCKKTGIFRQILVKHLSVAFNEIHPAVPELLHESHAWWI